MISKKLNKFRQTNLFNKVNYVAAHNAFYVLSQQLDGYSIIDFNWRSQTILT